MKTTQALETLEAINRLAGRPVPIKFSYAIAVSRRRLSEFQQVYEEKRMELVKQFAKKDDKGEIVTKKITVKNADGVDEQRDTGQAELEDEKGFADAFKALGDEDVPITLHKVALADCPTEMSMEIMEALIGGGMLADEPERVPA